MGSNGNPSVFTPAAVAAAPEDPLFGLMKAYREDPSDKKVDLGIGAYRDNNAKPWILPVVKKVCLDDLRIHTIFIHTLRLAIDRVFFFQLTDSLLHSRLMTPSTMTPA